MTRDEPWDVRDPAGTLVEVLRRMRPRPRDVLVAVLPRGDSDDQALVDVVRVHHGDLPQRREASELLRKHTLALVGARPWVDGGWRPPQHVLVTVVCRLGRVVPGPDELFWLTAWRYANHHGDAFDGDVYLVTEHGWTGCRDQRAGFRPALHPRPRHLAVHRSGAQEP